MIQNRLVPVHEPVGLPRQERERVQALVEDIANTGWAGGKHGLLEDRLDSPRAVAAIVAMMDHHWQRVMRLEQTVHELQAWVRKLQKGQRPHRGQVTRPAEKPIPAASTEIADTLAAVENLYGTDTKTTPPKLPPDTAVALLRRLYRAAQPYRLLARGGDINATLVSSLEAVEMALPDLNRQSEQYGSQIIPQPVQNEDAASQQPAET